MFLVEWLIAETSTNSRVVYAPRGIGLNKNTVVLLCGQPTAVWCMHQEVWIEQEHSGLTVWSTDSCVVY